MGITFNVNDDLSVGLPKNKRRLAKNYYARRDATYNGLSAAYSMGNIAIKFVANDGTNLGGVTRYFR